MPHQLYRGMQAALRDAIQDRRERLGQGSWKTEAEGKMICGEIKGLEEAGHLLTEEMGKIVRLEEDDRDV